MWDQNNLREAFKNSKVKFLPTFSGSPPPPQKSAIRGIELVPRPVPPSTGHDGSGSVSTNRTSFCSAHL